jgi:hypothetical protein
MEKKWGELLYCSFDLFLLLYFFLKFITFIMIYYSNNSKTYFIMNPILKNILAVILGLFIGGSVNMAIIMLSGSIIPPPEGTNITTTEGLLAAMPLMEPKHFLLPFLAHALGTFFGAFVAAKIAANNKMTFALVIGCFFLVGGIMNIVMLPSPLWFTIVDLGLAYIPMAYLGGKLVLRKSK